MKKNLLIILLLFSPFALHAQWRVGASGGGDYNWYSINTQYQTDYRYQGVWAWNAAVFGQYNFKDWVGLRFELEVSERNHRFYRTGVYEGTNYLTRNTYLQVPVMTQFSFGGQKLRGFVHTGVYAGYWLASKQQGTMYDYLSGTVYDIDEPYVFQSYKDQRWDFGLAGGLGIEYKFLEHWALHVEGRCYYSFISTVKQYMKVQDYRYNTTFGIQAGFAYVF